MNKKKLLSTLIVGSFVGMAALSAIAGEIEADITVDGGVSGYSRANIDNNNSETGYDTEMFLYNNNDEMVADHNWMTYDDTLLRLKGGRIDVKNYDNIWHTPEHLYVNGTIYGDAGDIYATKGSSGGYFFIGTSLESYGGSGLTSYIKSAVNLNIASGATLGIDDGGSVVLNTGDVISGNVNAIGGTLGIVSGEFDLTDWTIEDDVNFSATGGTIKYRDASKVSRNLDVAAKVELSGGTLSKTITATGANGVEIKGDVTISDINGEINATTGGVKISSGSLTTNAENVTGTVTNNVANGYVLTGGTNSNTIQKTGETGSTKIYTDTTVTNTGAINEDVNVVKGTFNNTTGSVSGTTTINSGTTGKQSGTGSLADVSNSGTFEVSNGTVANIGNTSNAEGVKQTGGEVTGNVTNSGTYTISGGQIDGVTANSGTFNVKGGTVSKYSQESGDLKISNGANLSLTDSDNTITGGNVTLGESDGNTSGTLTVNNGLDTNKAKVITSGTGANSFTVTGENTEFTTSEGTNFANGSVIVGDGEKKSVLNLEDDSIIAKEIALNVKASSILNLNDSSDVTINDNDTWAGKIVLNDDNNKLTVLGDLAKTGQLDATKGQIIIGDGENIPGTLNLNFASGDEYDKIAKDVLVTINDNGKLKQSAGSVILDEDDNWDGAIELSGNGTLELNGRDDETGNTQTFKQSGGTLNLDGSSLDLATSDSEITGGEANIKNSSTLTLENGKENTSKVVMEDANSKVEIMGQNTELTTSEDTNLSSGTINLGDKTNTSKLNLENNGIIAEAVQLNIAKASEMNISGSASAVLDGNNDTFLGDINLLSGNFEMKDLEDLIIGDISTYSEQYTGSLPYYNQKGGTLTLTNTNLSMVDSSEIEGGDLVIDKDSTYNSLSDAFSVDNLTTAGEVNAINGGYEHYGISEGLYAGDGNGDEKGTFKVDLYARSNSKSDSDTFGADDTKIYASDDNTKHGELNISDWELGGDTDGWDAPIDRNVKLGKIFKGNVEDGHTIDFTSTNKEKLTPIGWYALHSTGDGNFSFDLTRYNPTVFRGQITKIAQYQNQLMIDDMLFNHMMLDQGFKGNDFITSNPNRFASASDLYPPYQYSRREGGLWVKSYGTFEKLNMNHGLNVGNNGYGTIIGADFGLKDLKHGWQFMPTAYIGYNGAHQYWDKNGAYQNGGQAGLMGTWYKNNFIIGALAYGGVYGNKMDTPRGNDTTLGYFAGTAVKTAYNWRFAKNWALQPNLLAAYNFFGKENWHTDFGQMGMMSGMLHGINIAPGLNLIWEKDTFSIYGTIQYMYNVNQSVGGRAGHVNLPHVHMDRGYIQYGLGINKRFSDRFSAYLQAVIRNAGRTGIGLQAGMQWEFGEGGSKNKTAKADKTTKVAKSTKAAKTTKATKTAKNKKKK